MSVYFKHASLEQLKPISIGFALFTKNYTLFPPNLKVFGNATFLNMQSIGLLG